MNSLKHFTLLILLLAKSVSFAYANDSLKIRNSFITSVSLGIAQYSYLFDKMPVNQETYRGGEIKYEFVFTNKYKLPVVTFGLGLYDYRSPVINEKLYYESFIGIHAIYTPFQAKIGQTKNDNMFLLIGAGLNYSTILSQYVAKPSDEFFTEPEVNKTFNSFARLGIMPRAEILFLRKDKGFVYGQSIGFHGLIDIRNAYIQYNQNCTILPNGYIRSALHYTMYFGK